MFNEFRLWLSVLIGVKACSHLTSAFVSPWKFNSVPTATQTLTHSLCLHLCHHWCNVKLWRWCWCWNKRRCQVWTKHKHVKDSYWNCFIGWASWWRLTLYENIFLLVGESSPECSRAILGRESTGVISSYNYPFDYKHNQTCIYEIFVGQTENTGQLKTASKVHSHLRFIRRELLHEQFV